MSGDTRTFDCVHGHTIEPHNGFWWTDCDDCTTDHDRKTFHDMVDSLVGTGHYLTVDEIRERYGK